MYVLQNVITEDYLEDYDVDYQPEPGSFAFNPAVTGIATWTDDIDKALKFDSFKDAVATWQTQSTKVPLRPDGEPNRPLTAYTVSPVKVEQQQE